jgi:hypothetical protein
MAENDSDNMRRVRNLLDGILGEVEPKEDLRRGHKKAEAADEPLNRELMERCIKVAAAFLEEKCLYLPPAQKARLTMLLYDECRKKAKE